MLLSVITFIVYTISIGLPLWSSGQSSWLQIQRSRVVGLEWGQLSLMSAIEELLGRNSSGFGLEWREYSHGDLLCWPHDTLYPQKLALILPTSGGRSVGIVCSQTKATGFLALVLNDTCIFVMNLFLYLYYVWVHPVAHVTMNKYNNPSFATMF
jgi:hypothetical protein